MRAALQEGERAPADVVRADNAYREEAAVCTHTVQQGLSPAAAAVRETSGGTPGAVSTCYRRAEVRAGCYSEILRLRSRRRRRRCVYFGAARMCCRRIHKPLRQRANSHQIHY